jgi:GNAT superfamily N-acetyltransferase
VLFIWDMPQGDAGATKAFLDAGFEVQSNVTLLTSEVTAPPNMNREIVIRRIETDEEWEAVLAFKIRHRDPRFDVETYTPYKTKWLDVRRRLADSGRGDWYGAFLGDRLVGDLGIYRDGTVARFQDVMTEPEFRRRGICGRLVYEVSKQALECGSVKTLVMAADENYHAARIYESVGFAPREWHAVAGLYPAKT